MGFVNNKNIYRRLSPYSRLFEVLSSVRPFTIIPDQKHVAELLITKVRRVSSVLKKGRFNRVISMIYCRLFKNKAFNRPFVSKIDWTPHFQILTRGQLSCPQKLLRCFCCPQTKVISKPYVCVCGPLCS